MACARGNNLKKITVDCPLGVLCLVTGVSGSGKSTLVEDTLYRALCRRHGKNGPKPLPHEVVYGTGQIDDVILIDHHDLNPGQREESVFVVRDDSRNLLAAVNAFIARTPFPLSN